jgi:hypothetical protein
VERKLDGPNNTPRSPEGERASSGAEGRLVGYAMKPCCGYCAEERQTREGMPFCDCRLVDRICERHTPPVKSESVNGEAVNVAAEAQGGACCNKAVERFVAEVRERSRRRQVEVETDHAMRPGSLERFEVDGITGEAFDEVCSERNIK